MGWIQTIFSWCSSWKCYLEGYEEDCFLLGLSCCQILRRILEFKFDVAVGKTIWNVTFEIGGKIPLCLSQEKSICLSSIFIWIHLQRCIFFLYFESKVYSGLIVVISTVARYFLFSALWHMVGLHSWLLPKQPTNLQEDIITL